MGGFFAHMLTIKKKMKIRIFISNNCHLI